MRYRSGNISDKNNRKMKIAVFCSANNSIAPVYFQKTEELGRWMAAEGHTLVYGGCNSGLMECVGRAVHEGGGMTIGVIPTLVEKGGRQSQYVDVEIPCDNLDDRKHLMQVQCDVAVALPGGIGTLDEVFTLAASHTIGYHQKMVILYNIDGFWDSLVALLDDLQAKGMIRGDYTQYIQVANNFDELRQLLAEVRPTAE
jgi:uncharacterized protein (TIGR00730 family)